MKDGDYIDVEEPSMIPEERYSKDDQVEAKHHSFASKRAKIQLTFKNITVTAAPKRRGCCKKSQQPEDGNARAPDFDEGDESVPKIPRGHKVILDNLSGTVKPGEFLAILGASGAGKTTLLNYLSAKDISRNLKKQGTILINGINRKKISFSKYCAYV